ncbi:5'-3' exonuclease [Mycoplasma sp. E35C]|uniref:5'-3' exonuclease n=1 Tax=Mycoplasma sp. E35C TaxID=2801918 RepID=UPI001CA43B25|nr:5'-3' exonuclease [Mycoplasma sp. E35C]QZX49342.1 5'-3' exonuclease [Mycoplasma sp. E35C]
MNTTKKALVIDGNSLVFRAFYATIGMYEYAVQNNLRPNNGIKTSLLMINKIIKQDNYDYALIAFDSGQKTDRAKVFEGYKATRKKPADGLIEQLIAIQDGLKFLGFKVLSSPGIEADDLVGSFSVLANKHNIKCDVYSSDQDIYQLVNQNTTMYQFVKGVSVFKEINDQNFAEHFHGLKPLDVIEYKALVGDSSDNIPGVKGIGIKTAIELIKQHKNIEGLYANLDSLKPSIQKKLIESKELCFLSKQLATIKTDCLIDADIEEFKINPMDAKEYFAFCDFYNINYQN